MNRINRRRFLETGLIAGADLALLSAGHGKTRRSPSPAWKGAAPMPIQTLAMETYGRRAFNYLDRMVDKDGLPYFNIAHWLNPMDHGVGTYGNVITGVDISTAVSADTAVEHLQKVFGTIASIKMPNGLYPRRLRPAGILAGPTLFPQAAKLTGAQFIASASSGGGGGTTDLAGYVKGVLGFGTPWCADELAGFESDTTYFVVAEQLSSSQLGGLVYIEREPFHVTYYTGEGGGTGVSVDLDRTDTLEWHIKGRNVADYGHPYLIFKCTA